MVADQLSKVIDKTARLIELCSVLQEENDLLKLENDSLSRLVENAKNKNSELEEKLRVMALARSLEGKVADELELNEKTLDIKQKIAEFVGEIDKCIVLLKK
jgi:FtsZ-binding cell division protein ZapB